MLKFKATPTGLMFFKTRSLARAFASRTGRKVQDMGTGANGSRWGVKVTI